MPETQRQSIAVSLGTILFIASLVPATSASDVELRAEVALRGMVFDRGRSSPGPHEIAVVERDGSIDVVVAGIRLDRLPLTAPEVAFEAIAEPAPYVKPQGVDRLDGSGYPAYLHRLLEHRRSTVGETRALDDLEAHVRQSDLVARYERLEDGLLLFDAGDTPYFVGEQPLVRRAPMSRPEVEALALRTLEAYRKLLEGGGAILHFDEVDLFLPAARVADTLMPSLAILEDDSEPLEAKRLRLSPYWKGSPVVEPLLSGYRSSPELRAILDRTRKGR